MYIQRLKLVTFDITDTLLAFRIAPGQYYADVAARHGINCDGKVLAQNFKTHFKDMVKNHPNYGLESGLGWEMWWKLLILKLFRDCNSGIDNKKLDALSHNLIDAYKTFKCWKHCNGALDLLSYLKHKGLILGVISNFDPRLETTLENARIRHYFEFIISSYQIGIEKPNAKIFNEAMRLSNIKYLKPDECLHVGDSHNLDYTGAKNAGWNAVLINTKNKGERADYIFSSLFEFHRYFLNNNGEKLFAGSKT